jgi:hypothetical protein
MKTKIILYSIIVFLGLTILFAFKQTKSSSGKKYLTVHIISGISNYRMKVCDENNKIEEFKFKSYDI